MSPQYFEADPTVHSQPQRIAVTLAGRRIDLVTDRGVFAQGGMDRGTALLLETAPPPPPQGEILDVGCGYGPIAISMAILAPDARVWAIDINARARDLCQQNAEHLRLHNLVVRHPDDVPADLAFTAIASNPPIRVGKVVLHDLLARWLDRLMASGHAHLVVHRHLGADSLARWLEDRGNHVTRLRSRNGYRVLEVSPTQRAPL